jgi:MarR-like DNA-binding transcriptional regulator SgrR of sgrS sRNA
MTHEEIADLLGCSRRKVGYLLDRFHSRASRLITLPEGTTGGA